MLNNIKLNLNIAALKFGAYAKLSTDECKFLLTYITDLQNRVDALTNWMTVIPEGKLEVFRSERNERIIDGRRYVEYAYHYIIPIEPAEAQYILEAERYVKELGLQSRLKRIYYSKKIGFVAVLVTHIEATNMTAISWVNEIIDKK